MLGFLARYDVEGGTVRPSEVLRDWVQINEDTERQEETNFTNLGQPGYTNANADVIASSSGTAPAPMRASSVTIEPGTAYSSPNDTSHYGRLVNN
jgi:hypothetical protein